MDRDEARLQKQAERDKRVDNIHRMYPELKQIDEQIASAGREGLLRIWESGDVEKAKQRLADLIVEKGSLLHKLGVKEDIYEVTWDCPICQDKGYIQPGEPCSCIRQDRRELRSTSSGLSSLQSTMGFDNFSFQWYDKPEDVERIVERMKTFCDAMIQGLPPGNLFLVGPVGNGKTHLCCAVANQLLAAGKTVIYTKTEDLLEALREDIYGRGDYAGTQQRQEEGDRFSWASFGMGPMQRGLLQADLLILEDLGTERLTDFAQERIISLVDQRISWQKPWIITSHLIGDQFTGHYDLRLVDRILGEGRLLYLNEESVRFKRARQRQNM